MRLQLGRSLSPPQISFGLLALTAFAGLFFALGYSVLRADTDVYFAEDPYPILHGPLLRPFALVVQQDFGGPLGKRPTCSKVVTPRHGGAAPGGGGRGGCACFLT